MRRELHLLWFGAALAVTGIVIGISIERGRAVPQVAPSPPNIVCRCEPPSLPIQSVVQPPPPSVEQSVGCEPDPRSSPAERSGDCNLARGARIVSASGGWGGGNLPDELFDGLRRYPEWYHGYAFTGGPHAWNGESCGARSIEIELDRQRRIDRFVAWHHGRDHVPTRVSISVWNGEAWRTVYDRHDAREALLYPNGDEWWQGGSTPAVYAFEPIRAHRVRYEIDNCDIEHGWLYEIELYGPQARVAD